MNDSAGKIRIGYTDKHINKTLAALPEAPSPLSRHFSHNEEFFLKLSGSFSVPSFPIHHDVRKLVPGKKYIKNLRSLIPKMAGLAPDVFRGLSYFFDPADILRPAFYRVYDCEGTSYLFLLHADLHWKAREHTLLKAPADNTWTTAYTSDKLFLEAHVIPLEAVPAEASGFKILQSISQTWIGEHGSGYYIQGIWIDAEITKFLSRLFLPDGKRLYPYYPFTCKYRAICFNLAAPEEQRRPPAVLLLHRIRTFLAPHIPAIEEVLKSRPFSEDLREFASIKAQVQKEWYAHWENVNVRSYLNPAEMKEYEIEI
ncbi:MAG: hypothetical protein LBT33_07595 [Spirochaetia bacterium]|jgi:hypothetical protein|nr:hypothetical protein [Spirochaetia bacterium]